MLAPAVLVLFSVTVVPTLYLLGASLTSLTLTRPGWPSFIGLDNFASMLHDTRWINSLSVQSRLSLASVSLEVVVGLGVALLLQRRSRLRQLARSALLVPMVLPPVVVAVIWKILLTPDLSVVSWGLRGVGLGRVAWLANPSTALWAIAVADAWEWFPFVMLIVLAALESLPGEPLDAARIDGASSLQLFRFVVFPLIRQPLIIAALFRFIDSLKAFPLIFVMTSGGPGTTTEPTNYYAYNEAFSFSNVGYGSAIALSVFGSTLLLSALLLRVVRSEHADE